MRTAIILLLTLTPAFAADKALMLNEQEQAAFKQILDSATKAGGIQIAPTTVYFLNKLNVAPTVEPEKKSEPEKKLDKDDAHPQ